MSLELKDEKDETVSALSGAREIDDLLVNLNNEIEKIRKLHLQTAAEGEAKNKFTQELSYFYSLVHDEVELLKKHQNKTDSSRQYPAYASLLRDTIEMLQKLQYNKPAAKDSNLSALTTFRQNYENKYDEDAPLAANFGKAIGEVCLAGIGLILTLSTGFILGVGFLLCLKCCAQDVNASTVFRMLREFSNSLSLANPLATATETITNSGWVFLT